MEVIYPMEIGRFAEIPALNTAAMKDELVAGSFGIAPPQVSAATAFLILILSGFCAPRCGARVYDSEGSEGNVRELLRAARDGDTIMLSAGTFIWTAP